MKVLLCSFLVLLCFGVETIESFDQTKFHTSDKNNVYFIEHDQKYDWYESLAKCAKMNMTLLTIESHAKSNEVNTLVKNIFGKNIVLWIGGRRIGAAKEFTWISNGEAFSYTFWSAGQPDFAGSAEFCAQIGWGNPNMEWNDHQCDLKFGFICEYRNLCKPNDVLDNYRSAKYHNVAFNF